VYLRGKAAVEEKLEKMEIGLTCSSIVQNELWIEGQESLVQQIFMGITLGRKRGKTSILTPSEEKK
jgi:hypothetical protein